MAATRKLIREAVRTVMADADYGFNAAFADIQASYGITDQVTLDFNEQSWSVFSGSVAARDAALTPLSGQFQLCIYTGPSQFTNETKGDIEWSGVIIAMLEFLVEKTYRDGTSQEAASIEEAELYLEAIEDAITKVFGRQTIRWGDMGVVLARKPDCPTVEDAEILEDGWRRVIQAQVWFRVDAKRN